MLTDKAFEHIVKFLRHHRRSCPPSYPSGGRRAASAAAVRRAGKLLRVLAQHLFNGPDPSRQTEALK
jgi:hypothetical protein